jgi:ubiquinone/menaquinone biosynthesis C-methylase UbiE
MYFYVINNNLVKENKKHWERIYETKNIDGVSWFQKKPFTSLSLIEISNVNKDAEIIDVGCGKSFLIDNLLEKKYSKVSLLDISNNALKEVKSRTKNFPNSGVFYNSDILDFNPDASFDLWHDRAVFHFLTRVMK